MDETPRLGIASRRSGTSHGGNIARRTISGNQLDQSATGTTSITARHSARTPWMRDSIRTTGGMRKAVPVAKDCVPSIHSQRLRHCPEKQYNTQDRTHDGGASCVVAGSWPDPRSSVSQSERTIPSPCPHHDALSIRGEDLDGGRGQPPTSKESRNSNRRGNGHVYGTNHASQPHTPNIPTRLNNTRRWQEPMHSA